MNGHVIELAHGSGGRLTTQLIETVFVPAFADLAWGEDQAQLPPMVGRLAFTTDSFVISPRRFPGGDIGSLAVHGTVNDLAMAGATPRYLSCGWILEAGLPLAELRQLVASMATAAREAGVKIVTGDTKVVEAGKGDGVFINTTGIGVIAEGVDLSAKRVRSGDALVVSGTLGDHGLAILSQRQGLRFDSPICSDAASLHGLVATLLAAVPMVRCLRDPTRGGVAAALHEIAQSSGVGFRLDETALPVAPVVAGACELLGLDPLFLANEGKLLAICPTADADAAVAALRSHPLGRAAVQIGTAVTDERRWVEVRTRFGGTRLVDWSSHEPLPRIC